MQRIGLTTVFTELRRRPALRKLLWPESVCEDFRTAFCRQEQRRELLSAMARLGASYIDLYLLAIARIGSFALGQRQESEPAAELAMDFVALLGRQKEEPGFHAFKELSQAAEGFDHIVSVNFPEAPSCPLPELARLYGVTLQKQVPVGRMSGGVQSTPGAPVPHARLPPGGWSPPTCCRKAKTCILSAGASCTTVSRGRLRRWSSAPDAWTDSAAWCSVGSTARPCRLRPDDFIQVYYPHLRDTVELLQVRRVLRRLNRFLRLIHRGGSAAAERTGRPSTRPVHCSTSAKTFPRSRENSSLRSQSSRVGLMEN